ncbi:hypothetical protein AZA_72011 [Nitrospirillum viridazoti Y2]|nr:hypothetical protein AZA_72011 [Nitrospirillum amazonense Y2]
MSDDPGMHSTAPASICQQALGHTSNIHTRCGGQKTPSRRTQPTAKTPPSRAALALSG